MVALPHLLMTRGKLGHLEFLACVLSDPTGNSQSSQTGHDDIHPQSQDLGG